jgi:hypothetical protein
MEFIGHGALGVDRVAAWSSYFGVIGIPRDSAMALMPLIGALDIALGVLALAYPARGALLYMAAWALFTALLRPLAGESPWEAVERAGNFGAPAGLYLLATGDGGRPWLRFQGFDSPGPDVRRRVGWLLRLTTSALLLGHGLLGLSVHKAMLANQYAIIGLKAPWVESLVGGFECALAAAVLLFPGYGLLVFVVAWKLATEALSPICGTPVWVFIEHGGSYAAPLALALILRDRLGPATLPLKATTA